MSGVREIDVQIAVDPNYSEYQIIVSCPKQMEITPQEVIDAISDAFLNEGELGIMNDRDPTHLDS